MYWETHTHCHFSSYDGFDKVHNKVAYAKELGHPAMALTDHGNMAGAIQLYNECKKHGIKPMLGCEVYFQPKFDPEKRRFHLCLYAMNRQGYENLCQILTEANDKNFHRYAHVTFDLLMEYSEGIICTSGCISSFLNQAIINDKKKAGIKALDKFIEIFGDNFYFEVQPISIGNGTQEKANEVILKLAKKYKKKWILATDSHFTRPDDFPSYVTMHKLGKIGSKKGEDLDISWVEGTYSERYMHSKEEIAEKFENMHGFYPQEAFDAFEEIYKKIDIELEPLFKESIPKLSTIKDPYKKIQQYCKQKLKATGRLTKEYIDRAKHEIDVIKTHDLGDYFLIVSDYIKYAKDNDIYVGPGRGSSGGSLVCELLDITDIDPIEVSTDFERFLRKDKKKMPDIDTDFENTRQDDVINYILNKYQGSSAKIITFGYYKSLNLINDLCKVYDVDIAEIQNIKRVIKKRMPDNSAHFDFEDVDYDYMVRDPEVRQIEKRYKGFVRDFCKLCGQVKYYGQHPAGVLVTQGEIGKYVPLMRIGGKKGQLICSYDKYDVEGSGMLKFDVLALRTLNVIREIEDVTGDKFDRRNIEEKSKKKMYEAFRTGNTTGIFQLNKEAAQSILSEIDANTINDLIAAISLNRPGPLQLKMHRTYKEYKENQDTSLPWYEYTDDAYGSIIYQEHVMRICNNMANMDPSDTDKIMKFKFSEDEREGLKKKFVKGAVKSGKVDKEEASQLFDAMTQYLFNKSHGAGYAFISEWQMYHKVRNPTEFWYSTIKWEHDEYKRNDFMAKAVKDGIVVFLPHVNYTSDFSLREMEGEKVIQMGYSAIKNVGGVASTAIQKERDENGLFKSKEDFMNRIEGKKVNKKVVESLLNDGALEFNQKKYYSRTTKFNSTLYMRGGS